MSQSWYLGSNVRIRRSGVSRRDFLRTVPLAGAACGLVPWADRVALGAPELRKEGLACILLWMQGGPSQFEVFSPKPGHANGGETKAISTSVPGIQISENLPRLSQSMERLCLLRSMTSREGSHPRASFLLHTGYLPTASVKYPAMGSHVAHQLGNHGADLPNFVRIGRVPGGASGGLLGVDFDPFVMPSAAREPDNTRIATSNDRFQRRGELLGRLEAHYESHGGENEVRAHRSMFGKASRMIQSPRMEAFQLEREPASVREAYGDSQFGQGCLLARRLVEAGVTFVEVSLGNWDTHDDNFNRSQSLCGQLDQPFAQLMADLDGRGMLDRTLVVWLGEFGRTPRINPRGGRDHYPRAFDAVLAGCGIRGGQVIGRTDAGGERVADRPIAVPDFFRTLCHALKIDADRENMSNIGRPIKIVDGGEVVREAFA